MPNLKSSGRLKADVVSYVVTATPPLSSHSLIAACFVVPWTLMTLRRLNLSISLHQLIMTLAGQTTTKWVDPVFLKETIDAIA